MSYTINNPEAIIVHHAYLPEDDYTFNEWKGIVRYHIEERDFLDVGYHYGIEYVNGKPTLHIGRKEAVNGAHCIGMNTKSIGICVVGGYDTKRPHDDILELLVDTIVEIRSRYGKLAIEPHNKYADKSCPGDMFPLDEVIRMVEEKENVHWAEASFQQLINNGIELDERRFDDNITRGEVFALLNKALGGLYK